MFSRTFFQTWHKVGLVHCMQRATLKGKTRQTEYEGEEAELEGQPRGDDAGAPSFDTGDIVNGLWPVKMHIITGPPVQHTNCQHTCQEAPLAGV